jgi:hypothetical protein
VAAAPRSILRREMNITTSLVYATPDCATAGTTQGRRESHPGEPSFS